MNATPEAILFDLDGTLADTAPDLAFALNQTLLHYGVPTLDYEQIRPVVSHGGIALIKLGFDMAPGSEAFEERRQFLLKVYADNLVRDTQLFPDMQAVLDLLHQRNIRWGIVTNKPAWLTDPLISAMALDPAAGCVISGDTCSKRKPHPEPILHACSMLRCDPASTWYVGDAGRDIEAGRAAGCFTVGALWGYLHPDDPPSAWQADRSIDQPAALLDLLRDDVLIAR